MKKALLPILILISTIANAGNLSALFSYCSFNVPNATPYVEVYLHVIGATVKFVPSDHEMKIGQIEVQWMIKDGDKIVHFDKYNLNSPLLHLTDSLIPDFIDQQRVQLNAGTYQLELSIKDKNSDSNPVKLKQAITLSFPADSTCLSDIELIEGFTKTTTPGKLTKSGYDIVPDVNSFYPKDTKELKFYAEVYHTDKIPADEYLVRYYISKYDNNKLLPAYSFNLKQKPAPTNVIIGDIPIGDLQSGNYNLNVEVRNRKNELLTTKSILFQRSNPQTKSQITSDFSTTDITNTFITSITEKDSLKEIIDSHYPISSRVETDVAEILIDQADVVSMQKFIYYFWAKRNPEDPEQAFINYMHQVEKVNQNYSSLNAKGYSTDRGRVTLQYGEPNTISREINDPTAYPYEIWQYYKLNTQSNRKFVFYLNELGTNNYKLIYSDAIGEIKDPNWESVIHKKQVVGVDDEKTQNMFDNTRSQRIFDNPH